MNNQPHWNQSFEELRSEEANYQLAQLSSRGEEESEPQSQSNRDSQREGKEEGQPSGDGEVSKEERKEGLQGKELKGRQENVTRQAFQRSGSPVYVRVGPNGERETVKIVPVNVPQLHQVISVPNPQINIVPPNHLPPHFPPSPSPSPRPNPQRPSEFKSLQNVRHITQQSFTPSQKTIVLNHISNQANGVYHSHVSTERMAFQAPRENNTRHSHIGQTRVLSPARVSFDYQSRNGLFNSHIPTSPVIAQRTVGATSSNAPHPSDRHFQHAEETGFWKEKYEELSRRWELGRVKDVKEQQVAAGKLAALQQNYHHLQESYDQLVQEYHTKLDQNQKYYEQIQQLKTSLNQRQLTAKPDEDLLKQLKEKDQQIKKLTARLESNGQGAQQQRAMVVGQLRQQNEQYQAHLQQMQRKYQQQMREMHEHATMLQMEIEQRDAQLRERSVLKNSAMRRSDNSQLILDRSRMESFDNTRLAELELHVGKLNSELNLREESFQRELKMANLNVAELVDRLKTLTSEKDQAIRNLQEKVGLLQSDLNKKESVIRNLRDDATRFPSSLAPSPPAQPAASVYSSAVNPIDHRAGEKEQAFKKEVENMRRSLFQREREKMILKQKYEQLQERLMQSEQALGKRKLQNQAIRRQLNDLDNLQHENEKLMQVLNKKNAQLLQMKEMLLQKEQYAGDFQNLSMENDRLRNVMVKKNEELSDMAERLYNEQKKVRELQNSHNPQIHELEEQIEHMHEVIAHKDAEISHLAQAVQTAEGNYSQVQFQLQRHRNIAQEYEELIRINMEKIQHYEEELGHYEQAQNEYQSQLDQLMQKIEENSQKARTEEQEKIRAQQKAEALTRELDMRVLEIEQKEEMQLELVEFKQKSTRELQAFESKQGDLQGRCKELQTALRNRQQRTLRAERQAEQARQQAKKHQHCGKTIQQMTERIAGYEMRIISLTMNRGYSTDSQPSQVFENRIIYRLKRENEALRQEVASLRAEPSEGDSSIKQRLGQFNSNLHQAIEGQGLKRVRSAEGLLTGQATQQNRQIERLKKLAQQMQQQRTERKKSITPEYIDMVFQQQIAFYRTKNSELEERVESLLKANRELKSAVEQSLLHKGTSLKGYYEGQLHRLEKQLSLLRSDRARTSSLLHTYEQRIKALESRGRPDSEICYNYRLGE